jgi:hypothetical protein
MITAWVLTDPTSIPALITLPFFQSISGLTQLVSGHLQNSLVFCFLCPVLSWENVTGGMVAEKVMRESIEYIFEPFL